MVEFIYEPFKTIVIHEIVQYDFQTFVYQHALGAQPGQLGGAMNWAEGIAFNHMAMHPTADIVKEQIKGRIHWLQLAFAFMPKHQQFITIPEGNIRIPVINLSGNIIFKSMADWIKKQYKEK